LNVLFLCNKESVSNQANSVAMAITGGAIWKGQNLFCTKASKSTSLIAAPVSRKTIKACSAV